MYQERLQILEFCSLHLSAKLICFGESKRVSLSVHGKILQNLVGGDDYAKITEAALLALPKLETITFNDNNIINNFTKM